MHEFQYWPPGEPVKENSEQSAVEGWPGPHATEDAGVADSLPESNLWARNIVLSPPSAHRQR